ncbi:MAG: TolC family protein [Elusimicrobia bacterium]|nr:TolC family protein [Elusimicrobiota bacterium]
MKRSKTRNQAICLLASLLFGGGQDGWSQTTHSLSTESLNLHAALSIAERDNPEILAARRRWEAARKRVIQAATPDKPRLDIERMYAPSGKNPVSGADEKGVSLTQEIPFPSTLYLRGSMASREAGIREQEYRAKVSEIRARARSAYAMLYLAQRSLEIFKENIDLMRRFAKVAESKYAAGHSTQSDALKAQVELTKMLNMDIVLAQDAQSAAAMLNATLGRPAAAMLGRAGEPPIETLPAAAEDLESAALANRPELRAAALARERAGRSLALARSEFLPDFMLQFRSRNDPMRGKTRNAMLGLSIPLWFWKPAAMIGEASSERDMSQAELEAMRLMTLSELHGAFVRAQTARRLAEIYDTSVLPQAEAALKVAESGYQAEKISFLELLDAQRSLLNFRIEYYQYLSEHQMRVAELERILGGRLRP